MIKLICEVTTEEEFKGYLDLRIDDDYLPYIKISMNEKEWESFETNLLELDGSITYEDEKKADFIRTLALDTWDKYINYINKIKNILIENGYQVEVV